MLCMLVCFCDVAAIQNGIAIAQTPRQDKRELAPVVTVRRDLQATLETQQPCLRTFVERIDGNLLDTRCEPFPMQVAQIPAEVASERIWNDCI